MTGARSTIRCALSAALALATIAPAQQASLSSDMMETGQTTVAGRAQAYRIRRLPVSSFPDLPAAVADQLRQRGCMIPQTYEAHRPENVIHGAFEHPGSSDWAVLCSAQSRVSLLVFFGTDPTAPSTVISYSETQRLQPHVGSKELGFNWGIDPASPSVIRQAQIGMKPRPPKLDHDALADSEIDQRTVYRYYAKAAWSLVDMPVE